MRLDVAFMNGIGVIGLQRSFHQHQTDKKVKRLWRDSYLSSYLEDLQAFFDTENQRICISSNLTR
jgi:hypothetical protein